MTIKTLAQTLNEMAQRLEAGSMQAEEILEMNTLARQLYERTLILQFKAFEEELADIKLPDVPTVAQETVIEEQLPQKELIAEREESVIEVPSKVEEPEEEVTVMNEDVEIAQERPAFRFGGAKTEAAPLQISLIDSIEEIKRMEGSINDKYKTGDSLTLSQKLNHSPIADLKTAIGINMRFQFTSALFSGDASAFNAAIEKLNSFKSFIDADEYIQNSLKDQYDWQMKNPTVKQLIELVERRYL